MSILIKGLKMPDCCWNCPCYEGEYGKCNISRKPIKSDKGRLADCPLIELPDHGDLIDRDIVWSNMVQTESFQEAQIALWNASVIIPSERSEE